ncbi:DUF4240 domain-containing protein [Streptomyces sp. NPDC005012]|uniref:DUF4240 domain-containing protein n=1 Tax=Streptomyces sp. NPDC005012 TaxID=3154558 RepID=UPI0033A2B089
MEQSAPMDTDTFWDTVEAARTEAASTGEALDGILVRHLAGKPLREILEFQERFDVWHDALYRWDVWAAAYLIGGGCSDDSFMDFRAGVIAQGRHWYERVAEAPDCLASHPLVASAPRGPERPEDLFYEAVHYVAAKAYERITGDEDAFYDAWRDFEAAARPDTDRGEPDMGEDFDFDDDQEMARRLPRLAALFIEA